MEGLIQPCAAIHPPAATVRRPTVVLGCDIASEKTAIVPLCHLKLSCFSVAAHVVGAATMEAVIEGKDYRCGRRRR